METFLFLLSLPTESPLRRSFLVNLELQDSVRLLAVEACVSIASLLQQEDVEQLGRLRLT